jgi:hypothetical protein
VATTYAYTDYQIRYNILTQLNRLRDVTQKRYDQTKIRSALDTVRLLTASIDVWQQVLDNNDKQRAEISGKHFIENRSFSAGAPFSSTVTRSAENTTTYDFSAFINRETALGGFVYVGDFLEPTWACRRVSNGVPRLPKVPLSPKVPPSGIFWTMTTSATSSAWISTTTPRYNTPLFKLNAGTSSCPNEPGTQSRDKPQIDLNRYTVSNVPATEPAVFVANIANVNESEEGREYAVRVIPSSNLDGAIIRMGGPDYQHVADCVLPAAGSFHSHYHYR